MTYSQTAFRRVWSLLSAREAGGAGAIPSPIDGDLRMSLLAWEQALETRTTVRIYDEQASIEDREEVAILTAMEDCARRFSVSSPGGYLLRVHRQEPGESAGWFLWSDGRRERLPSAPACGPAELVPDLRLGYEPRLFVSVACRLREAVAAEPAMGYRRALAGAGLVAHTGWLAALRHGLSAGIFAGARHQVARTLVLGDDLQVRHLLSLAVGHPAMGSTP